LTEKSPKHILALGPVAPSLILLTHARNVNIKNLYDTLSDSGILPAKKKYFQTAFPAVSHLQKTPDLHFGDRRSL
jgi:hypothetical protein